MHVLDFLRREVSGVTGPRAAAVTGQEPCDGHTFVLDASLGNEDDLGFSDGGHACSLRESTTPMVVLTAAHDPRRPFCWRGQTPKENLRLLSHGAVVPSPSGVATLNGLDIAE